MKKYIIILICLVAMVFSCTNEESTENNNTITIEVPIDDCIAGEWKAVAWDDKGGEKNDIDNGFVIELTCDGKIKNLEGCEGGIYYKDKDNDRYVVICENRDDKLYITVNDAKDEIYISHGSGGTYFDKIDDDKNDNES